MLALFLLNRINKKHLTSKKKQAVNAAGSCMQSAEQELYCRTCLNTQDLESIFYDKETEQKRSEDLKLVTGLEIKVDDGLSQKICSKCIETMNKALQFRRTSRKAQKTLLSMITGKTKKKHSPRLKARVKKEKKKPVDSDEYNDYSCDAYDYNYDVYIEKFDSDYDDPIVKVENNSKTKQKSTTSKKKKRMIIPNAMSYKCATCNKEFRMKATYKAHMRFHTNFCVCEACGKRCRNNNQLQEHKRARHGLYKIHKCAYCEYSSATKEALTIHERRHTGERPYVCDHCGATFHRRSNLVQHIAIHLPEKNFQCTLCNKWEKSKKRLQVHVYKVHRERRYRYICPRCPKTYKCPDHVRRHLVNHHDVPRSMQGPVEKYVINN